MTMAEKLRRNNREVVVKRGRKEQVLKDSTLAEVIQKCRRLVDELKDMEPMLKEYKGIIFEHAKNMLGNGGTLTFEVDGISCKVTLRSEAVITPENVPELKRILRGRFKDLVRVQTRYVCSQALIEEAGQKGITGLIELKELSPQLRWGSGVCNP